MRTSRRRTSRQPIREMRRSRRTSRRRTSRNPQRSSRRGVYRRADVPQWVRLVQDVEGIAEVGNGVRHSEPVTVPAGTSGEVVRSRGGYWVVMVDPEQAQHPTMVVIDAWEIDPYSVIEPYGLEANVGGVGVGRGFKNWVEHRYPIGQLVTFRRSAWGHVTDEEGYAHRVPVLPESEGIVRDRRDGYTYVEVISGPNSPSDVVLTHEQLADSVEPDSRSTLQENTGYLGRNTQRLPSKSLRPIVKKARKQGWEVSVTKKSHVRFVPPGGGAAVIASGSASDSRSIKNLRARLRRSGLDV